MTKTKRMIQFVREMRTCASLPSNVHNVKLDAVKNVVTAPPACCLERRKISACVVEWKRNVCECVKGRVGSSVVALAMCISSRSSKTSKQRYDDTAAQTAAAPYAISQVGILHASTHTNTPTHPACTEQQSAARPNHKLTDGGRWSARVQVVNKAK